MTANTPEPNLIPEATGQAAAQSHRHIEYVEEANTEPHHADQTLHKYEMVYAGGTRRVYADTEEALVGVLVDGYQTMTELERWNARLHYMIRAQVIAQAVLNADDAFASIAPAQQVVLQGPRHTPPVVATWTERVPLILVATFYKPAGTNPRPVREQGMEPNVIWVDPSDDATFLASLHDIGVVSLHVSD